MSLHLEARLDRRVSWLTYPFGHTDEGARGLLIKAGYDDAVTCEDGVAYPGADPFNLPRIAAGDPMTLSQFVFA